MGYHEPCEVCGATEKFKHKEGPHITFQMLRYLFRAEVYPMVKKMQESGIIPKRTEKIVDG